MNMPYFASRNHAARSAVYASSTGGGFTFGRLWHPASRRTRMTVSAMRRVMTFPGLWGCRCQGRIVAHPRKKEQPDRVGTATVRERPFGTATVRERSCVSLPYGRGSERNSGVLRHDETGEVAALVGTWHRVDLQHQ